MAVPDSLAFQVLGVQALLRKESLDELRPLQQPRLHPQTIAKKTKDIASEAFLTARCTAVLALKNAMLHSPATTWLSRRCSWAGLEVQALRYVVETK